MINDNTDCGNDQKKMSVKHWPKCNTTQNGLGIKTKKTQHLFFLKSFKIKQFLFQSETFHLLR